MAADSARGFPNWNTDSRLDPRGEVLLGVRSERAVFWPSVVESVPMPQPLDARWRGPDMTARTVHLVEDAARISPLGVGPQEWELGLPQLNAAWRDHGLTRSLATRSPAWS